MTASLGKVAVVTGAARGIGRALAEGFAAAGYDVAVTDLASQQPALAETKASVEARGRKAWITGMDMASKASVDNGFAAILSQAGSIDVLVNNAGILRPSTLEALTEADWNAHFDVNARGVLFACQAVLPEMRRRKSGRIVNIASIAGRQGVATQGHYAATKSAVITLTRVLAQEAGADGITVNAVCPGIIMTEMGRNNLGSDEAVRHWESVTSLKRLGQPEDVVGPALFFASDLSAFVTGQALNVCGGLYFH